MFGGIMGMLFLILFCFFKIRLSSSHLIYDQPEDLKNNAVGLLLGTAKHVANGGLNHFYQFRMEAATLLYFNNKINCLLVSGAKNSSHYDEPADMKGTLLIKGIPAETIFMDKKGFRTLSSMINCQEQFGQQEVTVISQRFHLERAIYIGRKLGMKVVGFCAADVRGKYWWKMWIRELFARTKCMWEIFLLGSFASRKRNRMR